MLHSLRSLRRSRNLTFQDLASLTGIPVRLLAEAEYDLRKLSSYERFQLALIFGVDEKDFVSERPEVSFQRNPVSRTVRQSMVIGVLATTLLSSALRSQSFAAEGASNASTVPKQAIEYNLSSLTDPTFKEQLAAHLTPSPLPTQAQPVAINTPSLSSSPTTSLAATLEPELTVSVTPEATAQPAPRFWLSEAGPVGCPLDGQRANIVVNQGYGVGTHAPAETMGGIDLAIDRDGDGRSEDDATLYATVLATHNGIVQIDSDTWPAGNHIWVIDQHTGWRTGYAHLHSYLVEQGSYVEAGTPIALVGLTGYTTGPHLHYHVWHGDTNVDPTGLVGVCRNLAS